MEMIRIDRKFYTGIGSRNTPSDVLYLMQKIAMRLAKTDYILRSGGATGADSAFALGCSQAGGIKHIYLPWKDYNNALGVVSSRFPTWDRAQEIASNIHPAWERCGRGARAMHARNVYQVLDWTLDIPSKFLICWAEPTKNGVKGGTNTAVQLAIQHNIPVYNLYHEDVRQRFERYVNVDEQ